MLLTYKNLKRFFNFKINEISLVQRKIIHFSILISLLLILGSLFLFIYNYLIYNKEAEVLEKNLVFAKKTETLVDSTIFKIKDSKELFYNYLLLPEKKNYQKYFSSLEENVEEFKKLNDLFLIKNKYKEFKIDSLYNKNVLKYKSKSIDLNFVLTKFKTDTISQMDTLKKSSYLKRFVDALLGRVKIQKEKQKINTIKEYKNTVDFNFFDSIPKKELNSILKNNPKFLKEYNNTKDFLKLNILLFESIDDYLKDFKINLENFKKRTENEKERHLKRQNKNNFLIFVSLFIASIVLLLSLFVLFVKTFEFEKRLIIAEKINRENIAEKNKIISKLSHETKTPLALISIFSNKLEKEIKNNELEDIFKSLKYTSKSLIHITSSIVQELKIENSKKTDLSIFNLKNEIEKIIHSLTYITNLNENNLFIKSDIECLNKEVNFNLSKLQQLFYNLVSNSNKYISNGFIEINFQISEKETYFHLMCSIKDNGKGINEKDLKEILNNKYHNDYKKYRYDSDSLNMGFLICKEIVEYFEGNFNIISKENIGTEVVFQLKINKPN